MSELPAVVRFVHLSAAVLLLGGFSFALLVARPAYSSVVGVANSDYLWFLNLQFRIARWCFVAIFASALLGLWLQALSVSESSAGFTFDAPAIFTLLAETQYGKVWMLRLVLLLVIGGFLFSKPAPLARTDSFTFVAVGFGVSAGLLASLSLAGHASAAEGTSFAMQVSADALHLLASGLWLGGLAPLALLLRRCTRKGDGAAYVVARDATQRFSILALVSVGILIVTGSYNAWNLVGGFGPLFGTAYGKLLLLKIALLLPLLAIGATNLLWLKPRIVATAPEQPEQSAFHVRLLTRNIGIEMLVGIGILLIVAHMGVTPPARHIQPDWPFSFRYDWSVLDKAPKASAEVQRGLIWAAIGGGALLIALARRRRRIVTAAIGFVAIVYGAVVIDAAVSTDAYPTTYKRPGVAYHAISVANGKHFYQASCVTCHGVNGYGDGPAAPTLSKKPVDLTAGHVNNHTAGDLFWWLTYGIEGTPMPGFRATLSDEDRWDVINFLRALSSGEKARSLATVIENEPWLIAPDFTYGLDSGEMKSLKDHRGDKIVLVALFDAEKSQERVAQLQNDSRRLRSAGMEVIQIPHDSKTRSASSSPASIVTEGQIEIAETYKLFARSFADEALITGTPHVEFLIDKQGYIRARWLPVEGDGWKDLDRLLSQVEILRKEKPRAPAPDEHVH